MLSITGVCCVYVYIVRVGAEYHWCVWCVYVYIEGGC